MRARALALLATAALLVASFALFQFTDLDLRVQDRLFNFKTGQWLVDKKAPGPKLLFYDGPKVLIAVLGGGLLIAALWPEKRRPAWLKLPWPRRRMACFLVCLATVPIVIGVMKARSDIYCPWSLDHYGGDQPHRHFFDPLPAGEKPNCGHCFPAGHSSGGFALMALALLFTSSRARWIGGLAGFTIGWTMGIYQMLKGAHFLSHTITTMLLAAIMIQVVGWLFHRPRTTAAVSPVTATGQEQQRDAGVEAVKR